METVEPKYRYTRRDSQRGLNFAFYFHLKDDTKIRVCKTFFRNTLDINDRVIQTIRNKTTFGTVTDDGRGKHKHHPKVDENIKQSVRDHINSIPRIKSHYLRAQTTREYMDGGKTIADFIDTTKNSVD